MKKYNLKQCKLTRFSDNNTMHKIAWIPTKFCIVGKMVTLKSENHEKNWEVSEVFNATIDNDTVKIMERKWRDHRSVTDV